MVTMLCVSILLPLVLHAAAVPSCHPGCRCEVESFGLFDSFSLTKVDCSGVGPAAAPVPIPLDTSYLDLSSNSIRSLSDSMLSGPGYTTLVSLDLSSNLISRVSAGAFSKLRYLEMLDLSHNSLEELTDGCFSGLPLSEVDLSNNRIQELSLNIFTAKGQGRPISLDASYNLLTRVTWGPTGTPPNIKSLSLVENRLRAAPKLQGIPLRYLNLDGNPIVSIEDEDFAELRDLVHLSLSGLPELSFVRPRAFRDLQSLQVLDMSNNPNLKALSPEVFSGLVSLQELNLSNSGVTSLPSNILSHLPSLRSATLRHNIHCWKAQKQGQFHRQIGQAKTDQILTCDSTGVIL
ncbi:tsukushin [Megalops cyprinoides]|uniref:tsukushin n=1 Tax=Megalops cyprinoides TaxID=118141 RepID=UPI0018645303|nr:tsukushin [Megalops cyprinoides]XP_036393032.1 tsukushin [Megalops cyprinoides]